MDARLLGVLLFGTPAWALDPISTTVAWSMKFPDGDVGWVRSSMSGVVVVATEEGLFGLDDSTGTVLWKKVDLREPENVALDVLSTPPFALLRLEKGQRGKVVRILVDLTTGREAWNSSDLGFLDVWQHVFAPALGLLVVSGKVSGDPDKVVMGVDMQTGKRLWLLEVKKKEAEHALTDGPVFFDSDSTLVTSGERMNRYDLRSGKRLWQSSEFEWTAPKRCAMATTIPGMTQQPEAQESRPAARVARPRLTRDGRFIMAAYGEAISVYDTRTGKPRWQEPVGLCGRCVDVKETDYGLLIHTKHQVRNDEMLLLDAATGNLLWQYPTDTGLGSFKKTFLSGAYHGELAMSHPVMRGDTAYFLSGGFMEQEIVAMDIASGKFQTLSKVKQSADYEAALQLVTTPDDLLVIGLQDLQWFDLTGKSVRRQQYEAPNDFGLGLLMFGGIALARATGSVESGDVDASYQPALDRMMRDYHATSVMQGLVFMLSANDPDVKGTALLGIDRKTGAIVAKVPTSKEPRFVADVANSHVFVMHDDAIQCYSCSRLP